MIIVTHSSSLNMCSRRISPFISIGLDCVHHSHVDDLCNCNEFIRRTRGKQAWNTNRFNADLLSKFEWIRLERHCFINPVWISIEIYNPIKLKVPILSSLQSYSFHCWIDFTRSLQTPIMNHTHCLDNSSAFICNWLILFADSVKLVKLFALSQRI